MTDETMQPTNSMRTEAQTSVVMECQISETRVRGSEERHRTIIDTAMDGTPYPVEIVGDQGILPEGISCLRKPFTRNQLASKLRAILHAEHRSDSPENENGGAS